MFHILRDGLDNRIQVIPEKTDEEQEDTEVLEVVEIIARSVDKLLVE